MTILLFLLCVCTLISDAIVGYHIARYVKIHPLIGIISGLVFGVIAFAIILLTRKNIYNGNV